MRPTIDEQLDGVLRLLDAVARDEGLSPPARDRLRDAGRLVRRVRGSWSSAQPFLVEDNATLSDLLRGLGADVDELPDPDGPDLALVAARNERLRARLSETIRALPDPAGSPDADGARARIGAYLRRRVDTDPT